MNSVLEQISQIGIIPVVVLDDAGDAGPLGEALSSGNLPAAEVTFRTAAAEESIRTMSRLFPDMLVGAGTVLTIDNAKRAADAGSKFIVSPGFDPEIVSWCIQNNMPVLPGTATPSEVIMGLNAGLDIVKFFPAEQAGGLSMIKAMSAAFVNMKFMPTGGINAENVREYLKFDKILACGGSWMVKADLVKSGDFDRIRNLSSEAAQIVREIRG